MKLHRNALATIGLCLLVPFLSGCTSGAESTSPHLESTVQSLLTQVSSQSTQIAQHLEYISHLSTRIPPLPSSPVARPQPTPFLAGSLLIDDGNCCVAAIAGQAILIPVIFHAASPIAEVTEMRVRTGLTTFDELHLSETEWEPFSSEREFEYVPPINWSAFYVTVQFRDALGNLSPVYSSDISVEGMPAPPTSPTATTPTSSPPRTGTPYVDAIIEAGLSGDPQALKALIFLSTLPCTTREGLGGPPKCLESEADGTLVEALPVLGSEGGHIRIDEINSWQGIGAARLYAVYRTGSYTYSDEFYPAGEFAVVFIPEDSTGALTLQVTPDGIVRFDHSFGPTTEQLYKEHPSDFILGPLPAGLSPQRR